MCETQRYFHKCCSHEAGHLREIETCFHRAKNQEFRRHKLDNQEPYKTDMRTNNAKCQEESKYLPPKETTETCGDCLRKEAAQKA
jgi:hypothetical protein